MDTYRVSNMADCFAGAALELGAARDVSTDEIAAALMVAAARFTVDHLSPCHAMGLLTALRDRLLVDFPDLGAADELDRLGSQIRVSGTA